MNNILTIHAAFTRRPAISDKEVSSGRPERTEAHTPSLAAEAARRSGGTSP